MKYIVLALLSIGLLTSCSKAPVKPPVVHCLGVWTPCQGDCGEGKGKQFFVVQMPASNGGMACEAADGAMRLCTASVCPVAPEAEFCKPEGKKFQCGTNEWWHLKCSTKENEKNEQVYFASKDAITAKAKEVGLGACVRVTYKDGHDEILPVIGAGPCLPCGEL